MFTSNVWVFIHCQFVIIPSVFKFRKIINGKRLMKNAELTATLVIPAMFDPCWLGFNVVSSGYTKIKKIRRSDECIINVILASTWICTKSFWFLRPTDELLSFKSARKPRILTMEGKD